MKIEVEYKLSIWSPAPGWRKLHRYLIDSIVLDDVEPAWKYRAASIVKDTGFAIARPAHGSRYGTGIVQDGEVDSVEQPPVIRWTRRLRIWVAGIFSRE